MSAPDLQPHSRNSLRARVVTVVIFALAFGAAGAWLGWESVEWLADFIIGPQRPYIRLRPSGPEERVLRARVAAAGAFAGVAVVLAAVVSRPSASVVAVAGRVLLYLLVTAIALACAAAWYRSQFAIFVQEVSIHQVGRRPQPENLPLVRLGDVPVTRVLVIAGVAALTVAALARTLSVRLSRRASPAPSD